VFLESLVPTLLILVSVRRSICYPIDPFRHYTGYQGR